MAKEMSELEKYYNKFNEDKRLQSRHGQVEFITSMKYIHRCLDELQEKGFHEAGAIEGQDRCDNSAIRILDIGAGTGRYSVNRAEEG